MEIPPPSCRIQVSCRIRPTTNKQKSKSCLVQPPEDPQVLHVMKSTSRPGVLYQASLDHIFPHHATQLQVYQHVGASFISEVWKGYHATILAYGQTGSGKTHTIVGDIKAARQAQDEHPIDWSDNPNYTTVGLLPRLGHQFFQHQARSQDERAQAGVTITFTFSMIEIYQEKLVDLLASNDDPKNLKKKKTPLLRIRQDKTRGISIDGATDVPMTDFPNFLELLSRGLRQRAVGAHQMNASSSRSHCLFFFHLVQRRAQTKRQSSSTLTVVDLAGSEMVRKTLATGTRLTEAKHINQSLTALGMVIQALTSSNSGKMSKHVPYRNSKLTRILQPSLGGNAKTHLILTCAGDEEHLAESISTLRFGARAQGITNKPRINEEKTLEQYKQLFHQMKHQIEQLSQSIRVLKSSANVKTNHETPPCRECLARASSSSSRLRSSRKARKEDVVVDSCEKTTTVVEEEDNPSSFCYACKLESQLLIVCDGNCGHLYHSECMTSTTSNNNNVQEEAEAGEDAPEEDSLDHLTSNERSSWFCASCFPDSSVEELQTLFSEIQHERETHERMVEMNNSNYYNSELLCNNQQSRQAILSKHCLSHQLNVMTHTLEGVEQENEKLKSVKFDHEALVQALEAKEAETDILRRTLDVKEHEIERLQHQMQHQRQQVAQTQGQVEAWKSQFQQHVIRTPEHQPNSRPATSGGPNTHPHHHHPSIQNWWHGQEKKNTTTDRAAKTLDRPFKDRLLGVLNTLQEETHAFKKLNRTFHHSSSLPAIDPHPSRSSVHSSHSHRNKDRPLQLKLKKQQPSSVRNNNKSNHHVSPEKKSKNRSIV